MSEVSNERTDYVNENITLVQSKNGLTFGTDAYLLYAYLKKMPKCLAADLGAGTGIISLLAAAKVQYDKFGIVLDKARKKIDEAGKTLEEAQSRNSIIQKKLRTVEEIEIDAASQLLGLEEGEDE